MSDAGLILFCVAYFVFTVGMVAFFLVQRLETEITTEGVKVRFFPIHRTFRTYKWEDISNAFVRKYSPIMEFGGWGIRFGNRRNGSAYNVSGNQGLQLEFKKGKKLLIGTQNPYEIERALKKIEQIKNENQLNKQ